VAKPPVSRESEEVRPPGWHVDQRAGGDLRPGGGHHDHGIHEPERDGGWSEASDGVTSHAHLHAGHHDDDHGRTGLITPIHWFRDLYRPHSHHVADQIDSALESSAKGIRATKISLAGLILTAALQLVIVIISGSVALLADTIHNFADALTSIPLWIAFVIGRRAATRSHTFGFRRAEDLAGLFIVAMIAFSAVLVGWESISRLLNPQKLEHLWIVMAAGFIGFLGNELIAMYRIRVGREIGSAALVADGYHARTDGFTSLAVVAAAVGVLLGFAQADPLVGLAITGVILLILKDAARQVLGRLMDAVDPTLVEMVERTAARVPQVETVSDVRVRWIGHRLDAALHVMVDCDLTVAEGHAVAEQVRHRLFHQIKGLDQALVHVDPCGHHGDDPHAATAHHGEATQTAGKS
jgi:cation diffusion facilitator family transporter